ncbi:hypothetical protein BHZ80_19205 [Salmonella enterica]|nr:hypothetical protein [Salmonella enterica]EAA9598851.1 hypothetical protein [Salmonella enterica]EAO9640091.1 hypothetical protein [Salmonella enterica]EKI3326395.1 hypothetical protein [Salmonella enterica]
MKKIILVTGLSVLLTACARPYGPAEKVIDTQIVQPQSGVEQTKITVTRNKQFIGSAAGGLCKFLVSIDGSEVALLRQNQFVTAYIKNGPHKLKVSNECEKLSMGMRKSLDLMADGSPQEYVAENGFWGQYRLWRVK